MRQSQLQKLPACVQVLEHEREEEAKAAKRLPDFKAGDVLELKLVCVFGDRGDRASVCIKLCCRGVGCGFAVAAGDGESTSCPELQYRLKDFMSNISTME